MTVGYPQGWIVAKLYGAGHHLKAALWYAGVMELVDIQVLKTCGRNTVREQSPSPVPNDSE